LVGGIIYVAVRGKEHLSEIVGDSETQMAQDQ
jgi:hypothetical protein